MNFWDLVDCLRIVDKRAAKFVVLVMSCIGFLFVPKIGSWMISQAIQREQLAATTMTQPYLDYLKRQTSALAPHH